MPSYSYKKIDAFTSGHSLGNPAACLYLKDGETLTDAQMLDVAKQHKGFVSEVIFCTQFQQGIALIYYSSECEVDFCGHGTIACMHSLIKDTPDLLSQSEIAIKTRKKGALTVYNRIREENAVFISAPEPAFIGTTLNKQPVAEILGLHENQLAPEFPLDVIDAGLKTLIVPVRSLTDEISVYPDEPQLKAFLEANDISIMLIFSMDTQEKGYHAHTRVFAPRFGYLEDPATGSGNSAFGHYMLKHRLWNGSAVNIEQGGDDRVFNTVKLSMHHGRLLFGGSATVRISGRYFI
jgi:PhzF family phenazine biosynthesis protein